MVMYVNKELNVEWWLPPRTASRMTAEIIRLLGFEVDGHHHLIYDEVSNRKIILNVRNPYSIMVSRYRQFYNEHNLKREDFKLDTFFGFINSFIHWVNNSSSTYRFYRHPEILTKANRKPDIVIRYETFVDDILSIDFIKDNVEKIPHQIEKLHNGKSHWPDNSDLKITGPYYEFYDQECADLVYNHYEHLFIFDGYEKDSWKTITI